MNAGRAPAPAGAAAARAHLDGDTYWQDIAHFLSRLPVAGKRVLLPLGEWPIPGIRPSYYANDDVVSAGDDWDIVVVHKAMIASLPQMLVRNLLGRNYILGNEVFCVFARQFGEVVGDRTHLTPVLAYADPRRLWRARPRRCSFIHIPKAAGTSMWQHLAARIPAHVYFASNETLREFDGDINNFELVGGHIRAQTLRDKGWIGHNFAILRDPVQRILSFIAHARRLVDYQGQLDSSFLLARQVHDEVGPELRDMLEGEANLQVVALGLRDAELEAASLGRALVRALALLEDADWSICMQDDMARVQEMAAAAFRIDCTSLGVLNRTTGRADLIADIEPLVGGLFSEPDGFGNDEALVRVVRRLLASTVRSRSLPGA